MTVPTTAAVLAAAWHEAAEGSGCVGDSAVGTAGRMRHMGHEALARDGGSCPASGKEESSITPGGGSSYCSQLGCSEVLLLHAETNLFL